MFKNKYNHEGPVLGYSWFRDLENVKDKRYRVCTECITERDDFDCIITQVPPRVIDRPQCDRCTKVLGWKPGEKVA